MRPIAVLFLFFLALTPVYTQPEDSISLFISQYDYNGALKVIERPDTAKATCRSDCK